MNKAKWILRAITVSCILIPLLFAGYTYRDNLLGLIVPPQLQSLMNGQNNSGNQQNNGNVLNSTLAQLGINSNNLQPPQFENLTYDSSTGIATLTLNLTNPLTDQPLEVSNFSLSVSNGTQTFTIQLAEPINIAANQTGNMSIPLITSDPQALQSLISGNQTTSNLQLSNLYADVNGVTVQIGNLNGFLQSGNNGNNNNSNNNGPNNNNNVNNNNNNGS